MRHHRRPLIAIALALAIVAPLFALTSTPTAAVAPGRPEFLRTWQRTDLPVSEEEVDRTWIWGPEGNTAVVREPYAEAPGGMRAVQYFDKARMEISTDTDLDQESPWIVTNGLLPVELMTGRLQLGDDTFEEHTAAQINIAGDPAEPGTPDAPTYAEVAHLMSKSATEPGTVITATIDADGQIGSDESFAAQNVTAAYHVPETDHTIASVFWDFMNSSGTVYVDGQLVTDTLFEDPFFAFGMPVTEAYWTTVHVGGEPMDVLVQVFERRVATYTPGNPEGWKVETGNVGQHYYHWRYDILEMPPPEPMPDPSDPDDCPACQLDYGRGDVGEPGREPLGQNAILDILQPYAEVLEGGMPEPVVGTGVTATINMNETIDVVANIDPASKGQEIYWVVDWNDGSGTITGLWDAHYGNFISHTWRGRGTYYIKVWVIDPLLGTRSPIVTVEVVVE